MNIRTGVARIFQTFLDGGQPYPASPSNQTARLTPFPYCGPATEVFQKQKALQACCLKGCTQFSWPGSNVIHR